MFGKKKSKENPTRVETVIGKGTSINGDLYCKGSLRVEGKIEGGEVVAAGDVFVGQGGRIVANIKGRNVIIAGDVRGDVDAKEKLEIVPTGVLIGDIVMSTLVIEDGATFKGKSESRKGTETQSSLIAKESAAATKEEEKGNKNK
ncbi:hypothetical protein BBF96_13280 [Anoxybacter fermentans]|uniref:Cell shape determination protein CcmA n=1 Tax=Anoxybacter fermentans TaxID=1323375 RepID=A0A3Q9HRT5_9FIRM|nr:polymer-forming cytoskeletal protein [Anoxybacter fermentans]AZR74288.1 hypothetical protein BBF96_13280 [Anoxybacter fermentans]